MNGDEHAPVRFSIWHKYSEALKKDGKFDDKKSRIIKYGRGVDPLHL